MKVLGYQQLREKGITYSPEHIRRLIAAGVFPKPLKLSDHPGAKVGFIEDEIDAYLAARAAARTKAAAP